MWERLAKANEATRSYPDDRWVSGAGRSWRRKAELIAIALASMVAASPACAQASKEPAPTQAAPTQLLQPIQMREDLDRLFFTIDHAHGAPYRFIKRSRLAEDFKKAAAEVAQPMTDLDFYRIVAPLVAKVRDSHTSAQPPEKLRIYFSNARRTAFPLDLRYVAKRPLVEAALGEHDPIPVGSEVLSIDGRPMAEVTRTAMGFVTVDGFNDESRLARLDHAFWYYYGLAFGPADRYAIAFRDVATREFDVKKVAGVSPALLAARDRPPAGTPSQRLSFTDGNVAVMTLDELSNEKTGDFLRQAFRDIAASGAKDLIIDVRNCPGGDDKYNNQLFAFFAKGAFRFYRKRDFRARSWEDLKYVDYSLDDFITPEQAKLLPPAVSANPLKRMTLPQLLTFMLSVDGAEGWFRPVRQNHFDGRVYLLAGGNSGSSAAELAALMHHLRLGPVIGEEPNGVYQGLTAGAIPEVELKNSKIRVRMPLVAYHNAVAPGLFEGRGVRPDFEVSQTIEDAKAGKDTVMLFALRLIEQRRGRPRAR